RERLDVAASADLHRDPLGERHSLTRHGGPPARTSTATPTSTVSSPARTRRSPRSGLDDGETSVAYLNRAVRAGNGVFVMRYEQDMPEAADLRGPPEHPDIRRRPVPIEWRRHLVPEERLDRAPRA